MYIIQPTYGLLSTGILDFPWLIHDKRDDAEDAQARARAKFYFDLLEKHDYPPSRVEFDVIAPMRKIADIVVYEDNAHTKPYLIANCREDWIRDDIFKEACFELLELAQSMQAKYCVFAAGSRKRILRVEDAEILDDMPGWRG